MGHGARGSTNTAPEEGGPTPVLGGSGVDVHVRPEPWSSTFGSVVVCARTGKVIGDG